ncbi:hypothetical protein FA15DRAFT_708319 [Coprinopsis marcescibilis]|uniref:Uncharacterized protein n=1 Tax=Coprinopsis marcescibilis TaxID=230819 RepID=A0A5C3KIV3_COPMA|nr:hypothetical protein FA15DRAFT_708319 [Coprinopsis marcescibilis]
MSANSAWGDYQLATTVERQFQYFMAFCFSYSTRYNFCHLESLTHAIWALVLEDLTAGISLHLLIIPQLTVTSSTETDNAPGDQSLQSMSSVGDGVTVKD